MSSGQSSQASTALAAIPTGPSLEVLIGDVAYQLPSSDEDPIGVLLSDGSLGQLLAGHIVVGGQTMTISSDLSGSTQLAGGITAQPAEVTTPNNTEDDSNGGGLFGALGGIAKGATSAMGGVINGVGECTTGALAVAAGTTGAVAKLQPQLSGAIGDMGKFVSSLNGIQKSFPGKDLTKGALDTFTGAQNLGRQSLNWMKSTENLVKNFDTLPTGVQDQVKSRCGDIAKAGGVLAQAKTAMEAFREYPWEEAQSPTEAPSETAEPSATNNPTSVQNTQGTSTGESATSMQSSTQIFSTTQDPSSTISSSQTSSSSSGTPTPTSDIVQAYGIISERGTTLDTFKAFITELDGGKGPLVYWDALNKQMYLTQLNATQAKNISQTHDFIKWIGPQTFGDENVEGNPEEEYRAVDTRHHKQASTESLHDPNDLTLPSLHPSTYTTRLALRAMGNPVPNSPWWKKMIAAPPPKPGEAPPTIPNYPDYQADDTGGKGTTIIILDDGYDLSVPVSLHFHSGGTYPNVFRIYDYPAVACRMTSCPTITQCHHRTDFNGSMRI
jgi:hypothetical protein